jgi:ATP-dependent Clp protease ATP-binding subunit ClpC
MFEWFTERARKVVVLAQEEARRMEHNYIGTEHLLLGLLREDEGVAARALGSLNVTLDEVREQVESIVGYGEEGTGGQAPFTPRSKRHPEFILRIWKVDVTKVRVPVARVVSEISVEANFRR